MGPSAQEFRHAHRQRGSQPLHGVDRDVLLRPLDGTYIGRLHSSALAQLLLRQTCQTDPLVQRAYAECAEGYGFRIDPCPPADPQKQGIVEAGNKSVKGNCKP